MSDDELEQVIEEDGTQELIEELSQLSIEAAHQIPEERVNKLIQDMNDFMVAHSDEKHMLNFIEMIFILSRALRFSLIKVAGPCDCEECEHCRGNAAPDGRTVH